MRRASIFFVYFSLLLAFALQLLPWSAQVIILRPDFVLLTLIFWLLRAPQLCNVGTAWFAGVLMDVATGGLFGQYALAYTITAYFALIYQRRLVLYNVWQRAAYVFVLLSVAQLVLLVLKKFTGHDLPGWQYFWTVVNGIMLWQIVMLMFFSSPRDRYSRASSRS